MNQNHPKKIILDQFTKGQLDDPVSIIIAAHTGSCSQCKKYLARKEEELAQDFAQPLNTNLDDFNIPDFSFMEKSIIESSIEKEPIIDKESENKTLLFKNKSIDLPPSLLSIKSHMSPWRSLGNISYSKVNVHGESSIYFVHFEPGAKIAEHSHDGNEYAYVVAGSFKDQHSEYITGDFASFTHDDSHHPYTEDPDGCLLLVSIDGPFFFKEGWARLLNPFRKLFFKKL